MSIIAGLTLLCGAVPSVEVRDLVVRYGEVVAVDGVSLSADAGEVVVVLGLNGAGKTSLVEAIEGYRPVARGSVRVLGAEVAAVRERIGVMLQEGGVYPAMSAEDAVRLFASYYPSPLGVAEVLARVGLTGRLARVASRRLSGGERQRLSLALALVGRPSVVFLDEPTSGVDVEGRVVVREVVRSLVADGCCVLLTTHDLAEAERVADRVVIVDHGRVVGEGPLASLLSSGSASAELRFAARGGLDVAALSAAVGGVVVREAAAGEYVVAGAPTPALVAGVTAWLAAEGVELGDLRAGRQRLEDVFLRLTRGESSS